MFLMKGCVMSEKTYYEHVADLPENLRDIHDYCWDLTGRPNFDRSLQIAIVRLLEISPDFPTFESNCKTFFFNYSELGPFTVDLAWHCYIKGMIMIAAKLESRG
jgi:hypothetical protein